MFLFQIFRSFRPLLNPLGFGASDFVEFVLAAILVVFAIVWRASIETQAHRLARRTHLCMALLFLLPIVLRLLLLPHYPVPTPAVADDFSYVLMTDTLLHGRLANPVHPFHRFFETFFVLQEPSYSSVFPVGQGIVLATGRLLFGNPWAGVLLSDWSLLRPLLLDAPGVGHAGLGTHWRTTRSDAVRPTQSMDE